MNTKSPNTTISQLFTNFLDDQKERISEKTLAKYSSIIGLYESYLESYWPGHSDAYEKISKTGGTFCGTFGAEDVTSGYGEFLNYFMPRKVMCGKETMQAAGTVTKKLAKWLVDKGYVRNTEYAQKQAATAAKKLPNAAKFLNILEVYCDEFGPGDYQEEMEDHFMIERIAPGKLWLSPFTSGEATIGPISIPEIASSICEIGWDIGGVVGKVGRSWRLIEVWNVSP